jgi:hypothetical protein
LAVAKALILLLMADLEPWTFPMMDYFRGHKEAFRFFQPREDDKVIDINELKKSFPWAAGVQVAEKERESKKALEVAQQRNKADRTRILEESRQQLAHSADRDLQESHVKWKESILFSGNNDQVKYASLNKEMHEGYHLHEGFTSDMMKEKSKDGLGGDILATSVPSTCPYALLSNPMARSLDTAPEGKSLNFSEYKNESESTEAVQDTKRRETKKMKAEKAYVAVQRARDRVEQADEQQAISQDWHGPDRREALIAAIHYNVCLAVYKARTNAEDDWTEMLGLVGVISEQVHELHRLVRTACGLRSDDSVEIGHARSVLKDAAIQLEAEHRELLELDNRMLNWQIVAKVSWKLEKMCKKAEYMLFCCEHQWKHSTGTLQDLPAALKRPARKSTKHNSECEKTGGDLCSCTHCPPAESKTRSRIDEYYQFVNPEVRMATQAKHKWTKMPQAERQRTALHEMAKMRDINDDSTKRMSMRDEVQIRDFLQGAVAERETAERAYTHVSSSR